MGGNEATNFTLDCAIGKSLIDRFCDIVLQAKKGMCGRSLMVKRKFNMFIAYLIIKTLSSDLLIERAVGFFNVPTRSNSQVLLVRCGVRGRCLRLAGTYRIAMARWIFGSDKPNVHNFTEKKLAIGYLAKERKREQSKGPSPDKMKRNTERYRRNF